jgi:hypothetical protein
VKPWKQPWLFYYEEDGMIISNEMDQLIKDQEGWTRRMFEEGIRIKKLYGLDAVYDFSLGNPDTEPPETLRKPLLICFQARRLAPIDICQTTDMRTYGKTLPIISVKSMAFLLHPAIYL